MYDPEPRIPLHLGSRATRIADMAEALFWAIDESGLRLPSRRDIARHSHVSEATISRRLRDSGCTEDLLAGRLAKARARTFPPGYVTEGWQRWLPETAQDLQDTRAWISCLALASHSDAVAEEVLQAWAIEHRQLVQHLDPSAYDDEVPDEVAVAAEILRAVVLGLAIRLALDPGSTHDHAVELLARAVAALQPAA
jgi:hypothetical protein